MRIVVGVVEKERLAARCLIANDLRDTCRVELCQPIKRCLREDFPVAVEELWRMR